MRRGGWWRSNGIALAVLIAIGVAAAWFGIATTTPREPDVMVVDYGATAQFHGVTFGPATAEVVTDTQQPSGSQILKVTVTASTGAGFGCFRPDLREAVGMQRLWESRSATGGRCEPDQVGPYELSNLYILPEDTAGPYLLVISPPDGDGQPLGLRVRP